MKRLRILPGAAGLVALTATLGFVGGRYELETESISRNRITPLMTSTHMAANGALPDSQVADNPAYLVELRRGDTLIKVLINATTGQIIKSPPLKIIDDHLT